ncbi:MAG: asparaginase [Bacteroidetes bacterium]|nr:asparaginase [Bacteroidota bacterium]
MKKKVLIIYTGGTIGMIRDHKKRTLIPFNFRTITDQIPELKHLNCHIAFHASHKAIDSSDVQPDFWEELATIIEKKYRQYDGFVILHGTDTMAYTASALSYMLENLSKPVILTGSQLPLGVIRTDAKRNLITAIEIAASKKLVPEVCIYFNSQLFRGNRAEKFTSSKFDAFQSLNFPVLAEAGVEMVFDERMILPKPKKKFKINRGFNEHVLVLKLFPGLSPSVIDALSEIKNLRGIVLETFGSGNAPSTKKFLDSIERLIKSGIIVLNISQCSGGMVNQTKYETGIGLKNIGVVSGGDMTTEAAITKMMFLLARYPKLKDIKKQLTNNLAGELSR